MIQIAAYIIAAVVILYAVLVVGGLVLAFGLQCLNWLLDLFLTKK
jgi:hypothetical protein